jgi:DNA polymerase III delta subunit
MSARRQEAAGERRLTCHAFLGRKSWKPLPPILLLAGDAPFFKELVIRRFLAELSGTQPPEFRRLRGPSSERQLAELPLSSVLDELRTPSFFAERRLVVVEDGDVFFSAHRDVLETFAEKDFSGGHLIIALEKVDQRTRFGKAMAANGRIIHCDQPYDRPPPWETRAPAWDSELSHWLVRRAREKGLRLDPQVAFALHDRAGTDLALLDAELDKISTYLAERRSTLVDQATVEAVAGDLREESIFNLVDLLLDGRRAEMVRGIERLFQSGFHAEGGALVLEPVGLALLFSGALLARLRLLRRAHALALEGRTSDDWLREGLVKRPHLPRFQRQLRATTPQRIHVLLERLYATDCAIKRGGDAERLMLLLVAE